MRIAGTTYIDTMVSQLNALTTKQYSLSNQVSTGLKIQKPEDDPSGMAEALSLQQQTSSLTQYANNVTTLQSRLECRV